MKGDIWVSRNKGVSERERTKRKISNNAFLLVVAIMIPPLVYLNLNLARTEIKTQQTVAFKNKLDEFLEISSANNNSNFGVQEPVNIATSFVDHRNYNQNLVLTAYLEPPGSLIVTGNDSDPFVRDTSSSKLRSISFSNASDCTTFLQNFPVDEFPLDDPFLPWIHDYIPSVDGKSLQFVAQN